MPSIGLTSASSRARAVTAAAARPSPPRGRRCRPSSLGRNSWSGGSSRRIVTGSPRMISKISMKSARCIGSSRSSAAWRSASVSARIISRITMMRSASKNMCSVRQSPTPSTRNSRAIRASAGVSALARTPRSRTASAQSRSVEKAPPISGGIVAGAPTLTWPLVPSTVMSAPSWKMRPSRLVRVRAPGSRRRSPAPTTHGRPRPRAITAAWLVMPPRTVSTPRAACMPRMSSGLVSSRTRIAASSWAAAACAASAVKTMRPRAAPGLAARPVVKTSRGAVGSICGWRCSIRLVGSTRSSASSRVIAPASARSTAMRTAARALRRTATASTTTRRPSSTTKSSAQASPSPAVASSRGGASSGEGDRRARLERPGAIRGRERAGRPRPEGAGALGLRPPGADAGGRAGAAVDELNLS